MHTFFLSVNIYFNFRIIVGITVYSEETQINITKMILVENAVVKYNPFNLRRKNCVFGKNLPNIHLRWL